MTADKLKDILDKHKKWICDEAGGERANLYGADLSGANLYGADLSGANLTGANLYGADLTRANLTGADLTRADLTRANLTGADLTRADLTRADLTGADLTRANLTRANLTRAKIEESLKVKVYPLCCPENGSYTAYKKAGGLIVELEIPADAQRSSAYGRKCRASKARVVSITTLDGQVAPGPVTSDHDSDFVYTVGETVEVPDFNTDRWIECAAGIHHFITRREAVEY